MKPTRSVDGVMRVNIQITHRVDGDDFINVLCLEHQSDDEDELPDLTRAQIEEKIRKVLAQRPDSRHWWGDELNEEGIGMPRRWADELVRRRFPELF